MIRKTFQRIFKLSGVNPKHSQAERLGQIITLAQDGIKTLEAEAAPPKPKRQKKGGSYDRMERGGEDRAEEA